MPNYLHLSHYFQAFRVGYLQYLWIRSGKMIKKERIPFAPFLSFGGITSFFLVKSMGVWIFIILTFIISPMCVFSQQFEEMQFTNQPITDILLALAEISGRYIIPDETVKGSASYYFAKTDFETAFGVVSHIQSFFIWDMSYTPFSHDLLSAILQS